MSKPSLFSTRTMENREEEVPKEAQYIDNPDIISVGGRASVV